ncbi:MAG: lysophospholipid acyltransferase family protein [Betaproteobacteria bacterium]|jgi:KDO2-lipid IV(A) lauroyltransferase|nr:MAG: lysophospholipid acyltransferase family protein [Betaproteobacteria bacterium]
MLTSFLRILAKLPLPWLHFAGSMLGWLVYMSSPSYAKRLRENLLASGICRNQPEFDELLKNSTRQAGKAIAELPAVWFRPQHESASWVRQVVGWELMDAAMEEGNGVVILTPHFGCFEVLAQYFAEKYPITVLYRPPRVVGLEPAMRAGRMRRNIRLATTNVNGVRQLLKALQRGEAIGLLPDQVPGLGDGEWAEFFGRPAYTMTLWSRLAQRSKAPVFLAYAVRLSSGAGFKAHFERMPTPEPGETAAHHVNRALEDVIRRFPDQYLWAYNRYKVPAGVQVPPVPSGPSETR